MFDPSALQGRVLAELGPVEPTASGRIDDEFLTPTDWTQPERAALIATDARP
jgi:hypothetical protein